MSHFSVISQFCSFPFHSIDVSHWMLLPFGQVHSSLPLCCDNWHTQPRVRNDHGTDLGRGRPICLRASVDSLFTLTCQWMTHLFSTSVDFFFNVNASWKKHYLWNVMYWKIYLLISIVYPDKIISCVRTSKVL